MSLPKKSSRMIVVDNVPYRWLVKPTDLGSGSEVALYVELHDEPSNLLCRRHYLTPDLEITPGLVEATIRGALSEGWNPKSEERIYLHNDWEKM